jgi:predicted unusual protein kinase regulating ubiquinone biosynthesis (AarF/ABC1/UbiB family)
VEPWSRYAKIGAFLLRYRRSGVWRGLDVDEAALDVGHEPATELSPERFVAELEELGPTFVKMGQALSTRPDLVPEPYLLALQRIQDHVATIPFDTVRLVIEAELGQPLSHFFESVDPQPLAAGSLAQVHAGVLKQGGAVVLKVQRPGLVEQVLGDLAILEQIAGAAQHYTDAGRRYGFAEWIGELRRSLLSELDFRLECDNLDSFAAQLDGYPHLLVPVPVRELSTARLLTMQRVFGVKVSAQSVGGRSWRVHANELLRAYLDQVFEQGRVHADPHPGNVLLTDDGRVALIDLGMLTHLSPHTRMTLLRLMLAAVDGEGDRVADIAEAMGTPLEDFHRAQYRRDVSACVSRYAAQPAATPFSEGRFLLELTMRGASCGIRPPPELTLLGKTLLNLETVLASLDPHLPLRSIVREHLRGLLQRYLMNAFSSSQSAAVLLDLHDLVQQVPRRIGTILRTLSENRLRVRLDGLEESRLLENMQKIANRISAGIITAALIIGAAMLTRVPGGPRVFGYSAFAFGLFLVAVLLGLMIVINALRHDRSVSGRAAQQRRRRR